jgi:hypothetical protein
MHADAGTNLVRSLLMWGIDAAVSYYRWWSAPSVNFVIPIDRLLPIPASGVACTQLVGMDPTMEKALSTIQRELPQITVATHRKAPMIVSRCPRGGKTTVLIELHKRLKIENIGVISVSFNRTSGYRRLFGESEGEALFRVITNQIDPNMKQDQWRKCDWVSLDRFIGDAPFVLLIDEINMLTKTVGSELESVLKPYFLDKKNRYLVMSSHHVFINDDLGKGQGLQFWSTLIMLPMPESYNVRDLRTMDELHCSGITNRISKFYGGIPALMYAVCLQEEEDPATKFSLLHSAPGTEDVQEYWEFIASVLSGFIRPSRFLNYHSRIDMTKFGVRVKWPLCYIMCVMQHFREVSGSASVISACILDLTLAVRKVGDGMAWESCTRVALLMRFALAAGSSTHDLGIPFDLCTRSEALGCAVKSTPIPQEYTTLEGIDGAYNYIVQYGSMVRTSLLVVFEPVAASFVQFDGFCAYFANGDLVRFAGYQCKDNSKGTIGDVPHVCNAGGYLLRSDAPDRTGVARRARGWTYYNMVETEDLLGWSLQDLISN